eukprot:GFYU01001476.1.p1 GENE.GFYU01001476.1~~GFYU01001476.1.p1  ORF type:complete len:274 (-),score=115.80 GFYU01001476.1:83-904(-)
MVQMVVPPNENTEEFQKFLNSSQYTNNGILRYERVFGHGFVSTGGLETTQEIVAMAELKPGMKVLDVGCGIGGGDFYMAKTYGVEVLGIDLCTNMLGLAKERQATDGKGLKCTFEEQDVLKIDYPEASFDVIYSRDTIIHIDDKLNLFSKFYKWLKPGGKVLISDYNVGPNPEVFSDEFKAYLKQRGYHLVSVAKYGQTLTDAGFANVQAQDRSKQWIDVLNHELSKLEGMRDSFLAEFSQKDYDDLEEGWKSKVQRCTAGLQMWGVYLGHKQ